MREGDFNSDEFKPNGILLLLFGCVFAESVSLINVKIHNEDNKIHSISNQTKKTFVICWENVC